MKRHSWLIATMAALFVLQAPLCALACTETTAAEPSTAADPPCHEENSGSSPAGESNSREDCGCDFAPEALVSQPMDSHTTTTVGIFVSPALRLKLHDSSSGHDPRVAQNADLPPPDILLLKSTLII